jgi:sugar/nucleoside kinase (ribokinase family)
MGFLIVVFGTVCLDRIRRVPGLPRAGGYVEVESEVTLLGGEAANTALALTSWGEDVILAGNSLGSGADGQLLRGMLERSGLRAVGLSAESRGDAPVCDIYITPDGERTMFGRGFSTMQLDVDLSGLPLSPGEWFTAEPNMGAIAREAARRAVAAGMNIYLMDFFHKDDPIAPGSYWQSSTDWVGERGNESANLAWATEWARERGCFTIVTDGSNGLVAASSGASARSYPPYPAPNVVDTTGAGDAFRAGMIYGLSHGWPESRALCFAAAAGCLSCASLGGSSRVPSVAEIRVLVDGHPDITAEYA